ncbi:MAG TPA: ABC transporter substrate-binding protein [Acetobacteraceae bacterium]|nr:ABC transporter substrate-binding protein [Acetobacteraceae bacterium]
MKRREFMASAAAGAVALAAPRIVRAESARVLKFIPQADLASLDPVWTTADVTRNHAFLVFDTLYGVDNNYRPHPQMAAGHQVDADGKQWDITLRDGLKFHDGAPVLARDCVASLTRWGKRDSFGAVLMAATDELSAPSDKVLRFRLKKPFPLLPDALAAITSMACIMPERLAKTDPFQQVTEMVGSGPYKFVAAERVPGSRVVYERFADYVPRGDGPAEYTAGPKPAYFDRVEWTVSPDPATNAAAMNAGEFDWWENPTIDLVPLLKKNPDLVSVVKDHTGEIGCLRFNALFPPFDNPAIRRVVLQAVNQREYMESVAGADPTLILDNVGLFVPGSPMSSTIGTAENIGTAHDPAKLKAALERAGYKGEKVVVLAASNFPTINAEAQVGGDMLKRMGFNVDYQSLDWGTVVQRRASRKPVAEGGWNIFFTFLGGIGNVSPASDIAIRSDGNGWFGWPTDPEMEKLRAAWFDAPDLAAQQKVCADMQAEFYKNPSYAPLGMYFQPTCFRKDLTDVPEGIPQFYRVRRV